MNFARDVVEAPARPLALLELARMATGASGPSARSRTSSARLAGALDTRHGVGRGDVVMTLIGNRPEWVLTMVACFRIGAVALPCNEQLRAKDLAQRIAAAAPEADRRRRAQPLRALGRAPRLRRLTVPDESLFDGEPGPARPSSSRTTRA